MKLWGSTRWWRYPSRFPDTLTLVRGKDFKRWSDARRRILKRGGCYIVHLALGLEVQTFSLMVIALDSYARGNEF